MGQRDQLLAAIDAIYDAAIGNVSWTIPLELMATILNGRFCALEFVNKSTGQMRSIETSSAPEITREYIEEYFRTCPRFDVVKPVGQILVDYDVIDEENMKRHPFYAEFLGSYGMRYFAGAYLRNTADDLVAISVQRTSKQGHAQNGSIRHFEALTPHLRRAILASAQLGHMSAQASEYAAGLDHLSDAIAFFDGRGRIVHMNAAADTLLRKNDGLHITQGTLHAGLADEDAALTLMTRSPAGTEPLAHTHPVELAITRRSGLPSYIVSAMPVGSSGGSGETLRRARTMLVMRDPTTFSAPGNRTLRQAFGLTRAEASLALALATGDTPASYARRAHVKMSTVRTQLSALLRKMQARRQADIVRMVTRLAAPFRI